MFKYLQGKGWMYFEYTRNFGVVYLNKNIHKLQNIIEVYDMKGFGNNNYNKLNYNSQIFMCL